jgi:predicted nucleotidyltransferase
MKDKIKSKLLELEAEKKIKILFAVESGSRAWGIDSANSDYDVRFVFKRNPEDYLVVNPQGDVITKFFDKDMNSSEQKGCFVDIEGFDILKFTRMLSSSNPTVIEWLNSDIVYLGEQNKAFKNFAKKHFNATTLYFHYKSMCKQNYLKYLKSGDDVSYKKYMYAMRGLLNAKYVAVVNELPPILFEDCVNFCHNNFMIPDIIYDLLSEAIKLKRNCEEKKQVRNYGEIDDYIESNLKSDDDAPNVNKHNLINELNEELRKIFSR